MGFMGGMAVPAVVRFGYGFLQGAEYAAAKLGIDEITVNYHYTGDFIATPQVQALAAAWYQTGVEVIFACGGGLGASVMAAADDAGKAVIGVDIDQSHQSASVITSAMKGLRESVYACIEDFYNGNFPGGEVLVFDAANDGVGLPMATSKFTTFTQAQYDAIFAELVAGLAIENDHDLNISELPLNIVVVTEH
jgi:basic membrane protein A